MIVDLAKVGYGLSAVANPAFAAILAGTVAKHIPDNKAKLSIHSKL